MESSHLVIFSTSGNFITKFNALRCISLSETLFWTRSRGRIPITLNGKKKPGLNRVNETFSEITKAKEKYFSNLGKKLSELINVIKSYWATLNKVINEKNFQTFLFY